MVSEYHSIVTNIIKEFGLKTPRAAIGKKFYFKKVLTRDPKKNVEVEGLRVWKIE